MRNSSWFLEYVLLLDCDSTTELLLTFRYFTVVWGKPHTQPLSFFLSASFLGTKTPSLFFFFSSTFLLHHPHVTCLPGHSCPVLSSLCLLLESCLNKVTFIHEWVSMTTRPQDFLSRRPSWCDGYRKKPKGEHRCSRATSVALIIALWAKIWDSTSKMKEKKKEKADSLDRSA